MSFERAVLRQEVARARSRVAGVVAGALIAVFTAALSTAYFAAREARAPTVAPARQVVHEADAPTACRVEVVRTTVSQAEVATLFAPLPGGESRCLPLAPSLTSGRPNGWKVFATSPRSRLLLLGLRHRDVIKRVQGVDVTRLGGPRAAWERLQQDHDDVVIEVERDGCPVVVVIRWA